MKKFITVILAIICLATFSWGQDNDEKEKTEWGWLPSFSAYGDFKNIAVNFSLAGAFSKPINKNNTWFFHGQGFAGFNYLSYKNEGSKYVTQNLLFSALGDIGTRHFRLGVFANSLNLKTYDYKNMAFTELGAMLRISMKRFSLRVHTTHPITDPYKVASGTKEWLTEDNTGVWQNRLVTENWVQQKPTTGADLSYVVNKRLRLTTGAFSLGTFQWDKNNYQASFGVEWKPIKRRPELELFGNAYYSNFQGRYLYMPNFEKVLGTDVKGWKFRFGVAWRFGGGHEDYTVPQMRLIEPIPTGPITVEEKEIPSSEKINEPFDPNACWWTKDPCEKVKKFKFCLPGGAIGDRDYIIDFGDGKTITGKTGQSLEVEHEYSAFGEYLVAAMFTDSLGFSESVTVEVVYKDCTPPPPPPPQCDEVQLNFVGTAVASMNECKVKLSFEWTDCNGPHPSFSQTLGGGNFNFVRIAHGTGTAKMTLENGGMVDVYIHIDVNGAPGKTVLVPTGTTGSASVNF